MLVTIKDINTDEIYYINPNLIEYINSIQNGWVIKMCSEMTFTITKEDGNNLLEQLKRLII